MSKKKSFVVVPAFIDAFQPSNADIVRVKKHMGSWLRVFDYIRTLKPSYDSLDELAYMMLTEYCRVGGPRMDIIVRLHGRFNHLRYELERVEIGARR